MNFPIMFNLKKLFNRSNSTDGLLISVDGMPRSSKTTTTKSIVKTVNDFVKLNRLHKDVVSFEIPCSKLDSGRIILEYLKGHFHMEDVEFDKLYKNHLKEIHDKIKLCLSLGNIVIVDRYLLTDFIYINRNHPSENIQTSIDKYFNDYLYPDLIIYLYKENNDKFSVQFLNENTANLNCFLEIVPELSNVRNIQLFNVNNSRYYEQQLTQTIENFLDSKYDKLISSLEVSIN